jgi:succinate-semialdehyde dehydrogenase/glutarate-semialdehyde dehydrogenase
MFKVSSLLTKRLKNESLLRFPTLSPKTLQLVSPQDKFYVQDPSESLGSSEPLAEVPDIKDLDETIEAASQAFKQYSRTLATQRAKWMKALADAQRTNLEDLATILSCESGKPIRESRGEIEYGAAYIEWFAEEAKRAYGVTIPAPFPNRQLIVTREPVGVCGFITPFNFPNAMLVRKAGAALAAGCTVVARPSEDVPLSAIAFHNLVQAIFPKNVFTVVTSSRKYVDEVGKTLCTDPRVSKISFTGSTAVGKRLLEQAASTVKRTSMELGGNASFIVFDCADVNAAVEGLIASKFRNAGQTCICSNRIFVHKPIYEDFLQRVTERVKQLRVGRALDEKTDIGCLIHERAISRVQGMVDDAIKNGSRLLIGGKPETGLTKNFFQPTILADVSDSCQVFMNEVFGPVVSVSPFATEDEVVARANATRVGLSSYVYATNASRIMRVTRALETGMIGVNTGVTSSEALPFGGVKESGHGREGSKYGLDDYTNLKSVTWQY